MNVLTVFLSGACVGALVHWLLRYGDVRDARTTIAEQARLLRDQHRELVAAHNAAADARRQTMHLVRERRTA